MEIKRNDTEMKITETEIARLREENERLRKEIMESLREQLTKVASDAEHYRAEAQRNADIGRQIHTEAQAEIERLKTRVQSLEQLPNDRPTYPGRTT